MRKRDRENILGKLVEATDSKPGQPICIRPFQSDVEKLDEIAEKTGEERSALVRRMIRFALSDKQQSFAADRCQGKLDWLIKNGRKNDDVSSDVAQQLNDILERIGGLEIEAKNMVETEQKLSIFLREIYCLASILVSSQNLTFTRLLEFTSPHAKEREQAVIIAAGALANQIAQAASDLGKFTSFHSIRTDAYAAEDLYLLTKIKVIKDLIGAPSQPTETA